LIKKRLYQEDDITARKTALSIATYIMKETMGLLHPYVPFISEEVWQAFKQTSEESIVISAWPQFRQEYVDESSGQNMRFLQDAISAIRNIRAEMNVPPGKMAHLYIRADRDTLYLLKKHTQYFHSLAKIESLHEFSEDLAGQATASAVVGNVELFVPLAELIDLKKEKIRLEKELQRLQGLNRSISNKLANENFVKKAPAKVVEAEKNKLLKIQESLKKVENNFENLTGI
jgi:valyl-tRNA synthetase